jgi:hypothetical protein
MSRITAWLVVAAALLATDARLLGLQVERAPQRIPGAWELATVLAQRKVPTGVLVPEALWKPTIRVSPPSIAIPVLLRELNARNPSVEAIDVAGVIRVASRRIPPPLEEVLERERYLDAPVRETTVRAVFFVAGDLLRGTHSTGVLGSGPEPGPECPANQQVDIPAGPTTVLAILDAVVRQRPGAVWLITYDEAAPLASLGAGLVCADGWWTVSLH